MRDETKTLIKDLNKEVIWLNKIKHHFAPCLVKFVYFLVSNVILSTYFIVKIIEAVVTERTAGMPTNMTQKTLKDCFHI